MNWLNSLFILLAAFLAVFWAAAFHGLRQLLGAQVDLLPAIMVYAGLSSNLMTVALTALWGGLWFDSLSANPLGISILPFFLVGWFIHRHHELILQDQTFARVILGLGASAAVPLITIILLLSKGAAPLLGWGTVWQLAVMTIGGGIATPIIFEIFGWLNRTFSHEAPTQSSFRPDREIRRGRA